MLAIAVHILIWVNLFTIMIGFDRLKKYVGDRTDVKARAMLTIGAGWGFAAYVFAFVSIIGIAKSIWNILL
jgi:hypothetical protein